jgi:hypothetical protein
MARPGAAPSGRSRRSTLPSPSEPSAAAPATAFAHASEAEFARILDFYGVRWEYEPHTFPILWNLDGGVAESFSPDFWLPDVELYVELTTLRQSLVRKKNRKLRRLRELYPDVRVKLFYGRDFRALMLKYGKLGLVEGLSGALGQSTLVRPPEAIVEEPLVAPAVDPAAAVVLAAAQAAAEVVTPGQAPIDEPVPSAATPATEVALPTAAASRSARRRRRRRAAAQLGRRAHLEEPPSQPVNRHDPVIRR